MREGNNPQGVSHAKGPFMAELYEIIHNENVQKSLPVPPYLTGKMKI